MNLAIEKVGEVLVVSPEGQINSGNAAGIEADVYKRQCINCKYH